MCFFTVGWLDWILWWQILRKDYFQKSNDKNRGTQNGTTGIQRSGSANGTGGEMMMPPMDGTGPRESGQRPTQTTTETKTE